MSDHARYAHRLARLDLATSCDMRAPSAASAVYALECAMDELAVALRIDPLELRQRCYSDRDQHNDRPYGSKGLRDCYRQGAEAFGWQRRSPEPRSMREASLKSSSVSPNSLTERWRSLFLIAFLPSAWPIALSYLKPAN